MTQSVLEIRGREGFFVKKTIIALAAASSVALSHGVAVADGNQEQIKISSEAGTFGSLIQDKKEFTPDPEEENENEGKDTTNPDETPEATGSSKIFGWDEETGPVEKFTSIASAVAAVVGFLGSISALFANIEKIVKQFTK